MQNAFWELLDIYLSLQTILETVQINWMGNCTRNIFLWAIFSRSFVKCYLANDVIVSSLALFFYLLLLILLTSDFCNTCQMCSPGPWNQAWVRPGAEQEGDPYLVSEAARIPAVLRECVFVYSRPSREWKLQGNLVLLQTETKKK